MLVSTLNHLPSTLLTPPSVSKKSVIDDSENVEEFKGLLQSSTKIESATIKSNSNSQFAVTEKLDSEEGKAKKLRNGRWSKEECKLFEEALQKFGKRWKKVEAYIGTRTGTQVRSHAQKYFMKDKGESLSIPHDQSVAPNTSIGATLERPETDCMKVKDNSEEKKIKSPKLIPLQEVTPQSAFTIASKDPTSKTTVECKYLLEHMRKFGFNTTESIYRKFNKLSDWVETHSAKIRNTITLHL